MAEQMPEIQAAGWSLGRYFSLLSVVAVRTETLRNTGRYEPEAAFLKIRLLSRKC